MKKLIALVVMAAMVEFLFVGVSKAADEPNRPKFDPNTFMGKVVVTKDANGVVTAAQLESRRRGTYNIVLDEKGKELAEKVAGKFVAVTGKVETKDNVKWLTVEKYKELQRPQGRRGPGDPNMPRHGPGGQGGPQEGGQ